MTTDPRVEMPTSAPPAPDGALWFVLPSYRDIESFRRLRVAILAALGASADLYSSIRFVVVDDTAGGDPETDELAELDDVTVLTPPFNLGHQRAIVFGLRTVKDQFSPSDYVVTMDSDGEDRPEDVPLLLERLREQPEHLEAVAVARRTKRNEPMTFKVLYAGFLLLFRILTGTRIRSGNFAAARGNFVRNAIDHPSFDLCYSSSLIKLQREVLYVPCPRGRRLAGESRMNLQSLLIHGVRMILPFADQIAVRSLVFFGAMLMTTLLAGIAFVVSAVVFDAQLGSTLLAVLVVTAALSFVSLGTFLVLFSGFAQSSAIGLKGIEPIGNATKPNHPRSI